MAYNIDTWRTTSDANTLASQRAEAYRLMRLRLSKPDELEER